LVPLLERKRHGALLRRHALLVQRMFEL
jgi:hypothetical protein